MSKMLWFFELLSVFDWITPAKGFMEDMVNDPTLFHANSWTFFIPYHQSLDAGYNARGIEKLMDKHGIHHWGSQITGGEYFFSVLKNQAGQVEYILNHHGVPISPFSQGAPSASGKPNVNLNNAFQFPTMAIVKTESGPARLIRWLAAGLVRG